MFKKLIQILMGQPTGFVSETDKFLAEQRKRQPELSESQRLEVEQYDQISTLRDGHAPRTVKTTLWRKF